MTFNIEMFYIKHKQTGDLRVRRFGNDVSVCKADKIWSCDGNF